jgi:hypothetical protein
VFGRQNRCCPNKPVMHKTMDSLKAFTTNVILQSAVTVRPLMMHMVLYFYPNPARDRQSRVQIVLQ